VTLKLLSADNLVSRYKELETLSLKLFYPAISALRVDLRIYLKNWAVTGHIPELEKLTNLCTELNIEIPEVTPPAEPITTEATGGHSY
jgi:hypothetical protein